MKQVVEQGFAEIGEGFLQQLKKTLEGLLRAERDRRIAELRQQGEKVDRWGYTVRKYGQTLWGALEQVRVPRLRGPEEIGLLEKYPRHALGDVLFALTVGGLSQRKVVPWVRRFLGGVLSPATIGAVLAPAHEPVEPRRRTALNPRDLVALVVDGIYLRSRRCLHDGLRKGVLRVAVGCVPPGRFRCWTGGPRPARAARLTNACSCGCSPAAWTRCP